jgi:D-glycero-alpha-D-manno-heptose-7-phosphate kinase
MLIARAPVRISLAGGGTDLPAYYLRYGGVVINTTINRYFYVILNVNDDDSLQITSSDYQTFYRHVPDQELLSDGTLSLPRAILHHYGVDSGLSMFLASEIPPGTGLGSSSAVAVALVKAVSTACGWTLSKAEVAAEACYIELEKLGMPIGKQDQYASAFGGLNLFQFGSDGVAVEPLFLGAETWQTLQRNLLLFFTGSARHSTEILSKQSRSSAQEDPRVLAALHNVKTMTAQVKACLVKGDLDGFGELLHHNWQEKKRFAPGISNVRIDEAYHAACQHGALGGKITGAGGGGFLMLYCREPYQDAVTSALSRLGLQRMDFRFEQTGAQVLMNSGLRLNSLATHLGHRQLHHRE